MSPVICFFENDNYFYSEDYEIHSPSPTENVDLFLQKMNSIFFNHYKIIQIDFEAFQNSPIKQDLIKVIVLKKYKLISKTEFQTQKFYQLDFKSEISKDEFIKKIKSIKNEITAGRIYQVNFTSSLIHLLNKEIDPLQLFYFYFNLFKADYSAYIPNQNSQILCYSPELFLEKKQTSIKTQPIKGTIQNHLPMSNLLNNKKENAELSMIVDLLRNDLQSICNDPVQVTKHREILKLEYVTHTYSEIVGSTTNSTSEILQKMLPGGSISGCPKKESLKVISEYEPYSRGFYTGCIGWWFENDFKLNLAIRSFLATKNQIKYFTGCGIVADSDPELEWLEFLNKSSLLRSTK